MGGVRLQTERLLGRMLILWSQRRNRWIESGSAMLMRMMMMQVMESVMIMQITPFHAGIAIVTGKV